MDSTNNHEFLLNSGLLIHVSTSGSGPRLFEKLWDVPGASKYFVGGQFLYKDTLIKSFIGHPSLDGDTDKETAFDMAVASYITASETNSHEKLGKSPVGIGLKTHVFSSDSKDERYAHIVIITENNVQYSHLILTEDPMRQHDDELISSHTLQILESIVSKKIDSNVEAEQVIAQRFFAYPIFNPDGTREKPDYSHRMLYLPSPLNPISNSHRTLCRAGEEILISQYGIGKFKARYLVSINHPEKPRLSIQEMLCKAGEIRAERWYGESRSVEFTSDSLYIEKARRRPGSVFIIGVDGMKKMLDPKWNVPVNEMLREMANLKVQFLVMGCEIDGKWTTCRDVEVQWPHSCLFKPLNGKV